MKFNQLLAAIFSFTALSVVMQPPAPALAQSTCACVTSQPQPQRGQKNRSSGNFSTQGCAANLIWTSPTPIVFDVKQDRSGKSDPTTFSGLTNGVVTGNPNQRSLYIANPRNASGNFRVCAKNRR
ncbi:DeoR family transcriptional regulator [Nostoc sp. JL33]|uniref:DeoR family transcriptional regulator n=1 Tax=Nostoc sp. JL33 TaxID=2815396 RepID=UPI0025F1A0EC|nr:DeoR family transcriptional regulator [Nostoc sp. JL33]